MPDREKVIRGLECCTSDYSKYDCENDCPYRFQCISQDREAVSAEMLKDALELLKAQEDERKRMITWLAKFCRHIDNGWMTDQENLEFFKGKMKQQFGWEFSEPPKEET